MPPTVTAGAAAVGAGGPQAEGRAPSLFDSGQLESAGVGVKTLEDVVLGVCEALAANGRAECPVCGGPLEREAGCSACGASLA
jgi:hypothetical protein